MSLLVLCPSRGRPDNAIACYEAFNRTRAENDTDLVFVIDADDNIEAYTDNVPCDVVEPSTRRGMTDPLNVAAARHWSDYDYIGFIGDDHRFRTPYWDRIFTGYLAGHGGGLAYGNDLARVDGDIPTQIFGDAKLWKALGWMALPAARHLYLDNTWKTIGDMLDRLFYFPLVIIEHVHPSVGKAEWDEQYRALNASEVYQEDSKAYAAWLESGQAERDVDRIRAAL